jgi:precorrin-2 methylase
MFAVDLVHGIATSFATRIKWRLIRKDEVYYLVYGDPFCYNCAASLSEHVPEVSANEEKRLCVA